MKTFRFVLFFFAVASAISTAADPAKGDPVMEARVLVTKTRLDTLEKATTACSHLPPGEDREAIKAVLKLALQLLKESGITPDLVRGFEPAAKPSAKP